MNIKQRCQKISQGPFYWWSLLIGGLSLLVVALFYQYGLDELPCVVCIQIRLWVALLVLIAAVGLLLRKKPWLNTALQFTVMFAAIGLMERSYLLLGTERGFIFADCGFNVGLPDWFAIEQWLPWIFQVETSCGYTPELIFSVTMAEALMLLSVLLSIVSTCIAGASLIKLIKGKRQQLPV